MKYLKWLAISLLGLLVLLIIFVALIPTLFGDRIRTEVDKQIETYVNADVEYGDVDLSLFRNFPRLSFIVEEVSVTGRERFDTLQLVSMQELSVAVDFWSAIGSGPIKINAVEVEKPEVHVTILSDGTSNLDIFKEQAADTSTSTSGGSDIELKRYAINHGDVIYDDRAGGIYVHLADLNHEGSGDFTATEFDLDTKTSIAGTDIALAGIAYLDRASVDYDARLLINTATALVTLSDNELRVNELLTKADGTVGIPGEDGVIPVDLRLETPDQDFRALWSVVPAPFTKDLDGLKTSGAFALKGVIKGNYVPEPQALPSFAFDLTVDDASVQYPDLPKAITGINASAGVRSAGLDLADLLIDVERFAFRLGANPFNGSLRIRQGTTNPAFNLTAEGRVDLADLKEALPLEDIEQFAGVVSFDLQANGTAAGAEADLRSVNSKGVAELTGIVYDAIGMPKVEVRAGRANFTGQQVALEGFDIRAGRSDVALSGSLTDPFALATDQGTLGGKMIVESRTLDANEWLEPSTETGAAGDGGAGVAEAPLERPFDRFDIGFDAEVQQLEYDVYTLTNAVAKGSVSSERLQLDALSFETAGSDVAMEGTLQNLFGYTYDAGELTGELTLRSEKLDLLALSAVGVDPNAPDDAPAAEGEYLELPERMSLRIATDVDQAIYDNVILDNVSGDIAVANQSAVIEGGKAGLLGGNISMDGGYQYLGPTTPPTFDLKYDIQNASFQEAYSTLNVVKQLAPVAEYITGTFNTNLVMSSTLGKDMMPDLTQLNADGFINTIDATLQNFGPLKAASGKLGLKQLDEIQLKNTKNWFTIDNGNVTVRPFDVQWQGIDATISGTSGLDQSMNYDLIALVPRELISKTPVGGAVNTGLDFLSKQANKVGVNMDAGNLLRVKVNMKGSIQDPDIGVSLLGTEGDGSAKDAAGAAAKDLAKQARDSVERVAQAKLNEAREKAEAKAKAAVDSVRDVAEDRARAAADEAKARAAEKAEKVAGEAAEKVSDQAKEKATEALKGVFGKKKKPDDR